jgi:hypothetical protein
MKCDLGERLLESGVELFSRQQISPKKGMELGDNNIPWEKGVLANETI